MVRQLDLGVAIDRNVPSPPLHSFVRYFSGFERVPPVRAIFGKEAARVLKDLRVEFFSSRFGYMAVRPRDAHLLVSAWHLKHSDRRTLYLDVVHELFHVSQFRRDRAGFLEGYLGLIRDPLAYFRNPIEVAAYRHTVQEGRRIGMKSTELADYLEVGWAPPKEHLRFLHRVGADRADSKLQTSNLPPVRIARRVPIVLRPFSDYFRGFETLEGIRRLFGRRTERILSALRVEFHSGPLGYIGLDHEGGFLTVSIPYLRDTDLSTLYLDVYVCLHFLKQFREGRLVVPGTPESKAQLEQLGRDLSLSDVSWVDLPTMIEAYRSTVAEARRIGMSDSEIRDYLLAPELGGMTPARHRRLLRNVGLTGP